MKRIIFSQILLCELRQWVKDQDPLTSRLLLCFLGVFSAKCEMSLQNNSRWVTQVSNFYSGNCQCDRHKIQNHVNMKTDKSKLNFTEWSWFSFVSFITRSFFSFFRACYAVAYWGFPKNSKRGLNLRSIKVLRRGSGVSLIMPLSE